MYTPWRIHGAATYANMDPINPWGFDQRQKQVAQVQGPKAASKARHVTGMTEWQGWFQWSKVVIYIYIYCIYIYMYIVYMYGYGSNPWYPRYPRYPRYPEIADYIMDGYSPKYGKHRFWSIPIYTILSLAVSLNIGIYSQIATLIATPNHGEYMTINHWILGYHVLIRYLIVVYDRRNNSRII